MSLSRVLLALLIAFVSKDGSAESAPTPVGSDMRIRTAEYDPNQLYSLRGFVGSSIELEFAPDEYSTDVLGDVSGITVGAASNHLVIKPKVEELATNLTVLTNKRAYRLDYRVLGGTPD